MTQRESVGRRHTADQGVKKPQFVTSPESYRPLPFTVVFLIQVNLRCKRHNGLQIHSILTEKYMMMWGYVCSWLGLTVFAVLCESLLLSCCQLSIAEFSSAKFMFTYMPSMRRINFVYTHKKGMLVNPKYLFILMKIWYVSSLLKLLRAIHCFQKKSSSPLAWHGSSWMAYIIERK